jgi:Zn-dependent protease with chaperone function
VEFAAYLTDGLTAERRRVRVNVDTRRLQILDADGNQLDNWPMDGLRLAEEVYRGQPVRLLHRDRGDIRLIVDDPSILSTLGRYLPRFGRRDFTTHSTTARVVFWGVTVAILATVLIAGVPRLAGPLARAVPPEWEEKFGDSIAESITSGRQGCRDADGEKALDGLVQRLAAGQRVPYPFKVRVSSDSRVNAFAAPGGRIVLLNGLIKSAQSPEEVAGVLAHEMAHVVKRHPLEGLIRALGLRFVIGMLIGDASGMLSGLAGVGEHLLLLSYSRDKEAEADRLGVEMLNRAGIRADGLATFFKRLQDEKTGDLPTELSFLSSHPLHEERIHAISVLAKADGAAMIGKEWEALKNICGRKRDQSDQ